MPIRLDSRSADFPARFAAFLATKREVVRGRRAGGARHHRRRAQERRPRADRADPEIRPHRSGQGRPARLRGRARCRDRGLRPPRARRAQARARPDRGLSPAPEADRRPLHRCARRRARPSLERDRGGRALRAGRHRGLSVVGADERGARQGRGRAARRHGGAGAGRQAQPAGARRGEARRRRRDLSHRRRAGGGGARLRHGDDQAGGQDRRTGQRLCGGGQARRVRHRRHRHDRRARPRC